MTVSEKDVKRIEKIVTKVLRGLGVVNFVEVTSTNTSEEITIRITPV